MFSIAGAWRTGFTAARETVRLTGAFFDGALGHIHETLCRHNIPSASGISASPFHITPGSWAKCAVVRPLWLAPRHAARSDPPYKSFHPARHHKTPEEPAGDGSMSQNAASEVAVTKGLPLSIAMRLRSLALELLSRQSSCLLFPSVLKDAAMEPMRRRSSSAPGVSASPFNIMAGSGNTGQSPSRPRRP